MLHGNAGQARKMLLVFYIGRCPTVKQNKRWHVGEEMCPMSSCFQSRSVKLDAHSEANAKTDRMNNKTGVCVSRWICCKQNKDFAQNLSGFKMSDFQIVFCSILNWEVFYILFPLCYEMQDILLIKKMKGNLENKHAWFILEARLRFHHFMW